MKKSFKIGLAFGLLAIGMFATAATIQTVSLGRSLAHGSTRYVTTDGSTAFRLKWNPAAGAIGSAAVAVESNGDLTFLNAAGAADTTIGVPTKNGTIDVSDAGADTFGEVCDAINVSSHWQCILVDVRPSTSANDVLTAFVSSATNLTNGAGRAINYNTADLDMISASLGPEYTDFADLGSGVNQSTASSLAKLLNRRSTPTDSSAGTWTNTLYYMNANATFSSGTSVTNVYSVVSDHAGATETLLWSKVGAATTVGTSTTLMMGLDPQSQRPSAIETKRGAKLIVEYSLTGTPVMTAGNLLLHGASRQEGQ